MRACLILDVCGVFVIRLLPLCWSLIVDDSLNLGLVAVIEGLKEKYQEALRRDDVKAIVVTGISWFLSGLFMLTVLECFLLLLFC